MPLAAVWWQSLSNEGEGVTPCPDAVLPGRHSASCCVRVVKFFGIMKGTPAIKFLLLTLKVVGSTVAIVSILWSSRQNVPEDTDGVPYFNPARGWAKQRGPVVGMLGVFMSLVATLLGLAATPPP